MSEIPNDFIVCVYVRCVIFMSNVSHTILLLLLLRKFVVDACFKVVGASYCYHQLSAVTLIKVHCCDHVVFVAKPAKRFIRAMASQELPYRAEYAKSGRASCKACKGLISKDILRMAHMVQVSGLGTFYHADHKYFLNYFL